MIGIPLPYKIIAVVAVVAAAFSFGYYRGDAAGRVAQLKDTVAAYETRKDIDTNTAALGDVDICIALGGMRSDCEQLRRVDEAPEGK